MHRGSSKGTVSKGTAPEILPLSASPPMISVSVESVRAASVSRRELELPAGSNVRDVLRAIGAAAEGSAVLRDDTPIPLDLPVQNGWRLTVVPTFSGG